MTTFRSPQINVYVQDVEPSVRFFAEHLGFRETFRTPETGRAVHVELRLEGLVLGFVDIAAASAMQRMELQAGPPSSEVVLWTDDVDREYARLLAAGATSRSAPHVFLDRLRAAWLGGPNGEMVQIVQPWSAEDTA